MNGWKQLKKMNINTESTQMESQTPYGIWNENIFFSERNYERGIFNSHVHIINGMTIIIIDDDDDDDQWYCVFDKNFPSFRLFVLHIVSIDFYYYGYGCCCCCCYCDQTYKLYFNSQSNRKLKY